MAFNILKKIAVTLFNPPTFPPKKDRFSLQPWNFAAQASQSERATQASHQEVLRQRKELQIGRGVYLSPDADVSIGRLKIGDNSAVGAFCQIGIDVEIGQNCTVNPGSIVRGCVRIGNDVRIASGAQVLGFDHSWQDLERPIWRQPLIRKGIQIGDDCWIGANALVLDGVRVGAHAIIGAGSVVTKDVADWTIVAGNPARAIQSRKYGRFAESEDLSADWDAFVADVREQMSAVLARSHSSGAYYDFPGDTPRVRPLADAIELAAMVGCDVPGFTRPELIEILTSWQEEATGLVPGPHGEDGFKRGTPQAANLEYSRSAYSVLSTGYALECLGVGLRYPVSVAHNMSSADLVDKLDRLPWANKGWQCGAWIDHFATACYFNAKHHGLDRDMSDLHSWLACKADAENGLWGRCSPPGDFLQPVNGFYRLTRGAHAQFGWNIGTPDRVIDSVLAHAHDPRHMAEATATACNVLDVVHPLYLCGRQTDYRRDEVCAVARFWLKRIIAHWQTDEGMRFKLADTTPARLQGTEMWLAIAWLCAHLLGFASVDDDFRPRGVHRL